MLDHHIQRAIVTRLKSSEDLTFTEMKPLDIENKLFTYHLKIVIREGFVEKTQNGRYKLTSAGEKLWKRMSESTDKVATRAHSVLFLIIRSENKGWLLYKRKTHPLIGKEAFMHATPLAGRSIKESASAETVTRTNLLCSFEVAGSGFFQTYEADELSSYTNFTLLYCERPTGILSQNDEHAEYFWVKSPDFSAPNMLPNMKLLTDKYLAGQFPFFIDTSVYLGA